MSETEGNELDLSAASLEELELFMEESDDRGFFVEMLLVNKARPEAVKMIYAHPNTPDEVRAAAARVLGLPEPDSEQVEKMKSAYIHQKAQQPPQEKKQRLTKKVQDMGVSKKIKLAMKGGSEARGILMKESNKLIILAVLANPRITESEVANIARNRSALEEALREITKKKEWMRNYNIRLALVQNPKTPAGLAMKIVPGLKKNDLLHLEKDKNVSEGVRLTARKMLKGGKK